MRRVGALLPGRTSRREDIIEAGVDVGDLGFRDDAQFAGHGFQAFELLAGRGALVDGADPVEFEQEFSGAGIIVGDFRILDQLVAPVFRLVAEPAPGASQFLELAAQGRFSAGGDAAQVFAGLVDQFGKRLRAAGGLCLRRRRGGGREDQKGSGEQSEYWDGKNDSAALVSDGKYMIVISATTDMGESCREVTECVVCKISDPDWNPGL